MSEAKEELKHKLAALSDHFEQGLPPRLQKIQDLWQKLENITWSDEAFSIFHRMVHSLSGSAATFGFDGLGIIAQRLDMLCGTIMSSGGRPTAEQRQHITALLESLSIQTLKPDKDLHKVEMMSDDHVLETQKTNKKIVYIVDDDDEQLQYMNAVISSMGYEVESFNDAESMEQALSHQQPCIIFMDVMLQEGSHAGIESIEEIKKQYGSDISVIFVSARNDMGARLKAVRAGGDGYISKPIDVDELSSKLNQLVHHSSAKTSKVLIIDDEQGVAEHTEAILNSEGITTHVITNPFHVMEPLKEFKPDLILLDLHMPDCSGLELAQMIRQYSDFCNTPIVFLSAESDLDKQMQAMQVGGDDFLTKPVVSELLIKTIRNRIHQAETLQDRIKYLSVKDGDTGLFNRKYFQLRIMDAVSKIMGGGAPCAILVLELDDFKKIKTRSKHTGTDMVIARIANIIREQVSQQDILARLSQQSVSLLLMDTSLEEANTYAESFRENIAKEMFQSGDSSFVVSCSIGITIVDNTVETADKCLLEALIAAEQAQAMGGNSVHVHNPVSDNEFEKESSSRSAELIRAALQNDRFKLVFQPIANLSGETDEKYEAFVRMHDGEGNEISPEKFLPVAERVGLLVDIERCIFEKTIQTIRTRKELGTKTTVFVKVSLSSLKKAELVVWLESKIGDAGVSGNHIVFELSDAIAMDNLDVVRNFCKKVKHLKCGIAIQHFGSNLNSSQLLSHVPVDYVKISGDYMHNLGDNKVNQDTVRSISDLAHEHGVLTIAEFVEDASSLVVLWDCRVNYVQGYFLQSPSAEMDFDFTSSEY